MWMKSILPLYCDLLLPDFRHADVLATEQQSAPESEKLGLTVVVNSINSQSYGEIKMATCFFTASWPVPFFRFCILSLTMVHLR